VGSKSFSAKPARFRLRMGSMFTADPGSMRMRRRYAAPMFPPHRADGCGHHLQ
jgi:hypothetical protein